MRDGPLVVVGDTLLDVDVDGMAKRLAPDAPVPVVDCYRNGTGPAAPGWPRCLPQVWRPRTWC